MSSWGNGMSVDVVANHMHDGPHGARRDHFKGDIHIMLIGSRLSICRQIYR